MGCIVIHRIHDSEHGDGGESGQGGDTIRRIASRPVTISAIACGLPAWRAAQVDLAST
jgi:hypothetical protein